MTNEVRALPCDEDAERSVLGAILIDNAAYDVAADELQANDFSGVRHVRIYSEMSKLRLAGLSIDTITLADQLRQNGTLEECGGAGYLAELIIDVASASEIKRHAEIVRKNALLRALIRLGSDMSRAAYDQQNPTEIIDKFSRQVFDIAWGRVSQPWRSLSDVITEAVDYIDTASKRSGALIGFSTGLIELDRMLGGFMRSDLVLIGARPSMGKTALACGMALSAAASGAKVGFISLEMSRLQLGIRFLAYEGRVDIGAMRTGAIRPDQMRGISNAAMAMSERLVWLDDSGFMNMDQVRTKCRQLASRDGLDILFVDYLQLLAGLRPRDGRAQQVSDISRELKLLAKELNITVVALSQLSRELERREDKRPMLSDLRESGGLEQDADIVLFIYRDEIYNEGAQENVAELIIRKHRNGAVGEVRCAFQNQFGRFEDLYAPQGSTLA